MCYAAAQLFSDDAGRTTAGSGCSVVPKLVCWLVFCFPVLLTLRRRWRWGWPLVAADGGSRYRQPGRAEQVGSLAEAEEDTERREFGVCRVNYLTLCVVDVVWDAAAHLAGQLLLKPGSHKGPGAHVLRLLLTPDELCVRITVKSD